MVVASDVVIRVQQVPTSPSDYETLGGNNYQGTALEVQEAKFGRSYLNPE